jgi:arginine deiminase
VYLFPPVPNLIFTRDIGITIADHLLLTRPAEDARKRESIITKYIAYFELYKTESDAKEGVLSEKVLELVEDPAAFLSDETDYAHQAVTIEGGDVMMIAPRHLVVGNSIRTSAQAIDQLTKDLFDLNLVDKVSVVQIPKKRDYMHIDTVFTQLKADTWIVFGPFSKQELGKEPKHDLVSILTPPTQKEAIDVRIVQFLRVAMPDGSYDVAVNDALEYLEDLFEDISKNDFGCAKTRVLYCADGEFPYNEREQWTDACNFLVLKPGVIIGYDRNIKTAAMLQKNGFTILKAADFVAMMEEGKDINDLIKGDTLITLSSSELSRARGGTHCMSMPLLRQ